MRASLIALIVAAAGCGTDDEPGAAVVVDGAALELPEVTAQRIDTFYMLSARAGDGALLELGFPTSAGLGPHSCDEGRLAGLVNVSYVAVGGQRYSSVYPISAPAHRCSFELDEVDASIALSALAGMLSDMTGGATVQLADGSFRAPVTAGSAGR